MNSGLGTPFLRSSPPFVALALVAAIALGLTVRGITYQAFAAAAPLSILISVLADFATVSVLLRIRRRAHGDASRRLLVWFYLLSGVCSAGLFVCIRLLPAEPSLLPVPEQTSAWILIGWQGLSAGTALAYAYLRRGRMRRDIRTSRRFVAVVAAAGTVVVGTAILCGSAGLFPPVLDGISYSPAYRLAIAPMIVVFCLVASGIVWGLSRSSLIDRAFAFSVFSVGIGVLLSAIGGERYTIAWYAAGLLYAGSAVYVFGASIAVLLDSRARLLRTELTLASVERESLRNAERIRSLWKIGADMASGDAERLAAVLSVGSRMIRPDRALFGYLSHLEQGLIVVDAVSDPDDPAAELLRPGASFGLERSLQCLLYADGHTCAWNNLHAFDDVDLICRDLGWNALIGTPVQIGRKTHFLVFGSSHAMDDVPFAEDDMAFVDVLAAFAAHQFSDREHRERIQFQMEHDALTGMKNRTQFRLALRAEIAAGAPFAIAYLDLDRFREINEVAGNMIGDELLVEIAAGLGGIDDGDFVARTSGDGFAVILRGASSIGDARERLARYAELFAQPFHTGDRDGTRMLSVTSSFGAACFPADGSTADDLLRSADVALDAAKERGGACVAFFNREMTEPLEQRYIQTVELSDAIEKSGLVLYYQPTFALDDCRITGAEALLRWNHPSRGHLLPGEFIAFAERNGLIGRLSRWVFDRAVSDLKRLPAFPADFRCFFNLATQQLDDLAFLSEIEERLRFVPQLAQNLGVEITETAAITNLESSMFALERFRRLGLRVAIDDFGTGYSSLSYLKRLPVDMIKIDRTFVTGVPDDQKDTDLCELLLQIAGRFGLTALAEGIETYAQLKWLREQGCTYGQGFLISKPLPFDEFAALAPRAAPFADPRFPRIQSTSSCATLS
jgi:diguanylate cyclase (GGDEF)-like protein